MTFDSAVILIDELRARIETGFSNQDKEAVVSLYKEVLNKDFVRTSCSDCYEDAFIEIYNYVKKEGKMKEKCSYTLKNGVLIQVFGTGQMFTNDNLTDEAAESYLKLYPKAINQFAHYPDDWEARVTGKVPEEITLNEDLVIELAGKLAEGVTKKALKEEYKVFEIDGKALTARTLDAYLKAADVLNAENK